MRRSGDVSQDPSDPKEAAAAPRALEAGETLDGRFRVEEPLPGPTEHTSYGGHEVDSGKKVVLIPVSAAQAKAVAGAKQVKHAHLGRLVDVVELDGAHSVLVAARVSGLTLAEKLAKVDRKAPVDAVRSALRVADALNALHDAHAVHGFVHAGSVIVEPAHGEAPVLVFFPAGDGEPLHAPERAASAAPTIADDTWAAAGLLCWMLTGAPPPKAGYTNPDELREAGVTDPVLRAALFPTLAADFAKRQSNLKPLRRELARWFVEHAGEEPVTSSGTGSHRPPPLPHGTNTPGSSRPLVSASRPPPPPPRRSRLVAFGGAAIALGLIGGVGLTFFRPKQVMIVPVARPEPEASASAAALEIGEVPVTAPNEQRLGSKLAACVAGYLPKGTFGKSPDVEWVCSESDPREGGEKLRVAIVSAAPKGEVTDTMKIFARIGWYEMPAFAMVRAGCCPDAKPLALPDGQCGMDAALREIGDAVVSVKDVHPALKKYTESIHCELNRGGAKMLRRSTRPAGGEDTAFLELVKRLE
ncbi:MAG TPA: hypothetical protein VGK73_25835 [Polyangiaceae bacterium]